jgi:hypothetical protein
MTIPFDGDVRHSERRKTNARELRVNQIGER